MWVLGFNDCNTWAHNAIYQSTPHDIIMVMPETFVPTVFYHHDVVVYANGTSHSPGGP
jgi:hypothetical protein